MVIDATPVPDSLIGGEKDHYYFTAAAGQVYIIETAGALDTKLRLYGETYESQLAVNDDDGAGMNAKIVWTCNNAGVYRFIIEGGLSNSIGEYMVGVNTQ